MKIPPIRSFVPLDDLVSPPLCFRLEWEDRGESSVLRDIQRKDKQALIDLLTLRLDIWKDSVKTK